MILITRPIIFAEDFAKKLEKLGLTYFIEPMLRIEPMDNYANLIVNGVADGKHIILTSPSACELFLQAKPKLNSENIHILSVGEISTQKLNDKNYKVINAGENAKELLKYIKKNYQYSHEAKFIHFCSDYVSGNMRNMNNIYDIEPIIIYHAIAEKNFSDELIAEIKNEKIKSASFFSSRTAEIFLNIVNYDKKLWNRLRKIHIFCISEKVSDKFQDFDNVDYATNPSNDGMIELIMSND